MLSVKAYGALARQSFYKAIAFRSEIILWFILDALPLVILLFVWQTIYATNGTQSLHGYTLQDMLQYYLLVLIINSVSASHFEQFRVQQIRDGKIDYFLTRPLSYLAEIFWGYVGGKSFYILATSFFTVVLISLLSLVLPIRFVSPTLVQAVIFIGLLGIGFFVEFFFALLIVLLGFWFEYAEGLEHFKWIIMTLFSGALIPVAMMPPWLATVTASLPIKYVYAVPIGVIQGTTIVHATDVLYMISFILALWALSLITWHFAKYHYSSAGG